MLNGVRAARKAREVLGAESRKTVAQHKEEVLGMSKKQQVEDLLHTFDGEDALCLMMDHILRRSDLDPDEIEEFARQLDREAWDRERRAS